MSLMIRCAHCRRSFHSDPRVMNQRFCGAAACQRARKTLWQQQKMATDPDYKENQRACQKDWQKRHPHYWRTYRARHPQYCQRNRLLQRLRDRKRSLKSLAKIDVVQAVSPCETRDLLPYTTPCKDGRVGPESSCYSRLLAIVEKEDQIDITVFPSYTATPGR